jgi:hypothetical protein
LRRHSGRSRSGLQFLAALNRDDRCLLSTSGCNSHPFAFGDERQCVDLARVAWGATAGGTDTAAATVACEAKTEVRGRVSASATVATDCSRRGSISTGTAGAAIGEPTTSVKRRTARTTSSAGRPVGVDVPTGTTGAASCR